MFCTNCAASIPAGATFCTSCGTATGSTPLATQSTGDGPMPPDLHWGAVLGLSIVTFGLFWMFWNYKVAKFVRKLDPESKAVKQALGIATVVVLQIGVGIILGVLSALGISDLADNVGPLDKVFESVVGLINIFMVIGMRKSILRHYNNAEPIGLKLNELMTIVFGTVYFQFHFSNIAAWKKSRSRGASVQAGAPIAPAC